MRNETTGWIIITYYCTLPSLNELVLYFSIGVEFQEKEFSPLDANYLRADPMLDGYVI